MIKVSGRRPIVNVMGKPGGRDKSRYMERIAPAHIPVPTDINDRVWLNVYIYRICSVATIHESGQVILRRGIRQDDRIHAETRRNARAWSPGICRSRVAVCPDRNGTA